MAVKSRQICWKKMKETTVEKPKKSIVRANQTNHLTKAVKVRPMCWKKVKETTMEKPKKNSDQANQTRPPFRLEKKQPNGWTFARGPKESSGFVAYF